MATEYRICWNASSNVTFEGATDWEPWEDDGDPEDAMGELEIRDKPYNVPPGLEAAIAASGFEWYVETREAEEAGQS